MNRCLLVMLFLAAPLSATTFHVTTANYASTLASAVSGDIIMLAAGSYGTFTCPNKSGTVTIQSDASVGATRTNVIFSSTSCQSPGNHISLINVSVGGGTIGNSGGSPSNILFQNIHWTNDLCINVYTSVNTNTTLDGGDFTGTGQSCNEGRLGIFGGNVGHSAANGVTIKNVEFTGGASDGIQITGGADGTVIGPGNYFHDILEGGCQGPPIVHCDAIQLYGADNVNLIGNFFYNDSTLFVIFDCNATVSLMQDNVFYQEPSSAADAVALSGQSGGIIRHNTFATGTNLHIYGGNEGCSNTGMTVDNNIFVGGLTTANFTGTVNWNLQTSGCTGANCRNGTPTYTAGGTNPTTYAGYQLTPASAGHLAASDGLDMGAEFSGTPQVSTPFFSPVSGTYASTQTVTISSSTSSATLCYTTDGTPPTADGGGTCTHGTTLVNGGTVSVASSETVQALGTLSGDTDSAVGSATYTIGIPVASLAPASLSFGGVNISTTSAIQTLTLQNSGTAVMSITSISLAGTNTGDFFQSNNCPVGSNLGNGASCTITVTFTPLAVGARSASVSVVDGASGSPHTSTLSGTGVQASISSQLNPGARMSGRVTIK